MYKYILKLKIKNKIKIKNNQENKKFKFYLSVGKICTVTFSLYLRLSVGLYSACCFYRLIAVNFGIEDFHLIHFRICEFHQN